MSNIKLKEKYLEAYNNRISINIDYRIKYHSLIVNYLKNMSKNQCIQLINNNSFKIDNNIILSKRIGTDSSYGIVYHSSGINDAQLLIFASKLMEYTSRNIKEVAITKKLSNYVLNSINPHFPIIYKIFICKNPNYNIKYPSITQYTKYITMLNELASGDFYMFINNIINNNIELLENAFAQIMMSILSFHRFTSLIHKDTHAGNFLFHKIKKGGYIHYVFNKKNIYIKNVGYLWIIWDYGLAKDMKQLHYFIIDYIKICKIICKYYPRLNFTRKLQSFINKIDYEITYSNNFINVENEIWNYLLNMFPDIFKTSLNSSDYIVNSNPFIIPNKFKKNDFNN
jgi:hypothetical protein